MGFMVVPCLANLTAGAMLALLGAIGESDHSSAGPLIQLVPCLVAGAIYGYMRKHLRENIGAPKENFFLDMLTWGVCPVCAAIQEARTVDSLNGVKVSCCCKLDVGTPGPLLGQPMQVVK